MILIQDSFFTQHFLEPTREDNVLYIYSFHQTINRQCKNI